MKFFKNSEKTHCLEKNLLVQLESIKILTSKYKYTGDYPYNKSLRTGIFIRFRKHLLYRMVLKNSNSIMLFEREI